MGEVTKIEWADHSWSPWMGCSAVHTGCLNCYAAKQTGRLGVIWGPKGTRVKTSRAYWARPRVWNQKAAMGERKRIVFPSLCDPFEDWGGPMLDGQDKALWMAPEEPDRYCSWVEPSKMTVTERRNIANKIFRRATMADVRASMFRLIDETPDLIWALLTKRPENVGRFWQHNERTGTAYRRNVWLLYSGSNQATLDAGLDALVGCSPFTPILGLSLEPLTGPVSIGAEVLKWLGWVIVGGESGSRRKSRPCRMEWIVNIVDQCVGAGVPVFVKQAGRLPQIGIKQLAAYTWERSPDVLCAVVNHSGDDVVALYLDHPKGGDADEWPDEMVAGQWPIERRKEVRFP